MAILIFSSEWDLHANAIAWALNQHGIAAMILDVTRFPSHATISFNPTTGFNAAIMHATCGEIDNNFNLADVKAVWCRRMMVAPKILDYSEVHPADLNNVIADSSAFITGMWHYINELLPTNTPWINPLEKIDGALSKAKQLLAAKSVGLAVPDTIMGNNPATIRDFFDRHDGRIIMKPFLQKGWEENGITRMQPTIPINAAHLVDDAPLKICPAIYQPLLDKKYELRVVVLGEKIIAAKLDSQVHDHSRMDWRLDAYKKTMAITPYTLTEKDKNKIHQFMQKMGLNTGSIDFIVNDDDDLIFLEVNQQGQFLFLEEQCPAIPILAEMARFLASAAKLTPDGNWPTYADYLASTNYAAFAAEYREYLAKGAAEVRYVL